VCLNSTPLPSYYRCGIGVSRLANDVSHLEPPLEANYRAARGRGKSVVPELVRPNHFGRSSQTASSLLLCQGDCLVGPWVCLACTVGNGGDPNHPLEGGPIPRNTHSLCSGQLYNF
jgi:hypothetical protein